MMTTLQFEKGALDGRHIFLADVLTIKRAQCLDDVHGGELSADLCFDRWGRASADHERLEIA